MIKIGVTGHEGFIGSHLVHAIERRSSEFELVPFDRSFFNDEGLLCVFVRQCDVVVHLAAVSRHPEKGRLLSINADLTKRLVQALKASRCSPIVLFSSSIHESKNDDYGQSKRESRGVLESWALSGRGKTLTFSLPNIYGPHCRPFYASFIATFCAQLVSDVKPSIINDVSVELVFVGDLVDLMLNHLKTAVGSDNMPRVSWVEVKGDTVARVSCVLGSLQRINEDYRCGGFPIDTSDRFSHNLFLTLHSYFPTRVSAASRVRGGGGAIRHRRFLARDSFSKVPCEQRNIALQSEPVFDSYVGRTGGTIEFLFVECGEVLLYFSCIGVRQSECIRASARTIIEMTAYARYKVVFLLPETSAHRWVIPPSFRWSEK
jgi:dTDP-4-dehydrorhamnose reductase